MIQLPPKIWKPKPENKYLPMDYSDDIDEGVFEFSHHGKAVYRPKVKWSDKPKNDRILFDQVEDTVELIKNLNIGDNVKAEYKDDIIDLIQDYWDCFCLKGAYRTIFDYKFAIYTCASKPVCCRWPTYGPHEKPIIMEQISSLLANDWIEECGGSWDSMIVLATKPHQEHIDNIKKIVWRMCVSY